MAYGFDIQTSSRQTAMAGTSSIDITIPRRVQRLMEKYCDANNKLYRAKVEHEQAKERFIAALKDEPFIGSHPAVQHHISNTELRELTKEERSIVFGQ